MAARSCDAHSGVQFQSCDARPGVFARLLCVVSFPSSSPPPPYVTLLVHCPCTLLSLRTRLTPHYTGNPATSFSRHCMSGDEVSSFLLFPSDSTLKKAALSGRPRTAPVTCQVSRLTAAGCMPARCCCSSSPASTDCPPRHAQASLRARIAAHSTVDTRYVRMSRLLLSHDATPFHIRSFHASPRHEPISEGR